MISFYKNHQKIIKRAFRIWGPAASIIISLYLLQLYGFFAFVLGLVFIGIVCIGIFCYLDFRASLNDESFRVIYKNLNIISKLFDNKISYKQLGFLDNVEILDNPYFSFEETDTFITKIGRAHV